MKLFLFAGTVTDDITTSIPISARLQTLSFAPAPAGTRSGDTPTEPATSKARS